VEPNYPAIRFVPLAEGRFISADDLAERRRVVVLGFKSASLLFPGRPMLGETITINDIAVHRGGPRGDHQPRQQRRR
jgi:putative ABC transport system permease protein